jgi:hypothetical protein
MSANALGEAEQFIDRPLVVGVGAVLHRVDPSGRCDQEVGFIGMTSGKSTSVPITRFM